MKPEMSVPTPLTSTIHLPVVISWKEIQKRAKAFGVGQKIKKSPIEVDITDLVIWEDQGLVKIQVETVGSYDGIIRMTARPVFNKVLNKFEFQNFNLDMASNNFFQRGMVMLLRGTIEKQFETILDQSLDQPIQDLIKRANGELKNLKPIPNMELLGGVENFKLVDFGYNDKGVILQMAAQGRLAVRIS